VYIFLINTKYQTVRTDKIPNCQNRQHTKLSEQTTYQIVRTHKIPDCQNRQNTRLSEHKIPDCQNRQNTRLSEHKIPILSALTVRYYVYSDSLVFCLFWQSGIVSVLKVWYFVCSDSLVCCLFWQSRILSVLTVWFFVVCPSIYGLFTPLESSNSFPKINRKYKFTGFPLNYFVWKRA
jgi:hypothetical protein